MAPSNPEEQERPSEIGVDDWVATAEARTERRSGRLGAAVDRYESVPLAARLGLLIVLAAVFPLVAGSDYFVRVGVNTFIYALLALGLNIAVGYAGLLDLGYVAFFGFGAYAYAIVSSDHFGFHWPTLASVPLIVVATAALGFLLGLPSRRLLGDYLAIVTLFFAQIFVTVVTNANRITPPGRDGPVDFTGGPNGIAGVDDFSFFGLRLASVQSYYYLGLVALALTIVGLRHVDSSRTGRAWRSIREDPLAAQLMGAPVNSLKLLAFTFGAAIAGFTGTVFAALQGGAFPGNFDLPLLITLYAMLILGGAGSIPGVVVGVVTINVVLEVLRTPENARLVFYGALLVLLAIWLRPLTRLATVVAATAILGLAAHALVSVFAESWLGSPAIGSSALSRAIDGWVVLLDDPVHAGNVGYALLIGAVIAVTRLRGRAQTIVLVPTLYLAAFVWENRLVDNPSVTRLILLGWLLVALMNARPQGLFGTARVEIV